VTSLLSQRFFLSLRKLLIANGNDKSDKSDKSFGFLSHTGDVFRGHRIGGRDNLPHATGMFVTLVILSLLYKK
jgi:hypothetical protein